MPSHRIPRVAEAIREVVSQAILFEIADPRVQGVTVLGVEVSSDLRHATVKVTIMGTETQQKLAMRGLQHASGFLQSKVARRLQTRFTPVLAFERDESVKKSIEISRLIDEAIASDRAAPPHQPTEGESGSDEIGPTTPADQAEPAIDPEA
ncbi:MAG: 30S ribosome-binding factor RbfA [Isosphaeraceae bacterium]